MKQININRQPFQTIDAVLNNGTSGQTSQCHLLTDFSKISFGSGTKSEPQKVPQLSSKSQAQGLDLQKSIAEANQRYGIQHALLDKMTKKNDSRRLTIHWLKNRILRLLAASEKVGDLLEEFLKMELAVYFEYVAPGVSIIDSPRDKENIPLDECDAPRFDDMWLAYCEVDLKLREQDYEHKRSTLRDESLELAKEQARLTKLYQVMTRLARMNETELCDGELMLRFHFVSSTSDTIPQFTRRLRARKSDRPETIIEQLPRHWQVSMDSKFIHPAALPKFNTPGKEIGGLEGWVEYFEAGGVVLVVGELQAVPLEVE